MKRQQNKSSQKFLVSLIFLFRGNKLNLIQLCPGKDEIGKHYLKGQENNRNALYCWHYESGNLPYVKPISKCFFNCWSFCVCGGLTNDLKGGKVALNNKYVEFSKKENYFTISSDKNRKSCIKLTFSIEFILFRLQREWILLWFMQSEVIEIV